MSIDHSLESICYADTSMRPQYASHIASVRSRLPVWLAVLVAVSVLVIPKTSHAAAQAKFGVYVTGIHELDVLNNSFAIDLYVWWVSRDLVINPTSDFQIVNGRHWQVRSVNTRTLPDGSHYTAAFVSAVVNYSYRLRRYPFDRHSLRVVFETPYTASELRLAPDVVDSTISELVEVPGFKVGELRLLEYVKGYDTRFGLGQTHADQFSRVVLDIEIRRESQYLVTQLFAGLLVANLISLLIYFVNVSALGVRATLATTAILAAIGNIYTLGGQFTPASRSLLVDRISVATFTMIVFALLTSIVAEWLYERDRGQAAVRVNWTMFLAMAIAFLSFIGWSLLDAIP